jgi:hypothetical protein
VLSLLLYRASGFHLGTYSFRIFRFQRDAQRSLKLSAGKRLVKARLRANIGPSTRSVSTGIKANGAIGAAYDPTQIPLAGFLSASNAGPLSLHVSAFGHFLYSMFSWMPQ